MNRFSLLRSLLLTGAASVCAFNTRAEERWPRWYLGLEGAYDMRQDASVSGTYTGNLNLDNGYGVGGQIGYMPPIPALENVRVEGELYFRRSNIGSYTNDTLNVKGNGDGHFDSTAYTANVYYDFRNLGWQVVPYVGAGAGGAQVRLSSNSGFFNTKTKDTAFAYQGMAGLAYSPVTIPMTTLNVGYRFFKTQDAQYSDRFGNTFRVQNEAHDLEAGVKFRF